MQLAFASARILHGLEQNGMLKEFTTLNHQLDASRIHVHDATGADVEVPDFAVAHLPLGQPNVGTAGLNEGIGILAQQAVVGRLACQRDGIGFGLGPITPAVEDDEDERFRAGHSESSPYEYFEKWNTYETYQITVSTVSCRVEGYAWLTK